jgi:hypothetical protein
MPMKRILPLFGALATLLCAALASPAPASAQNLISNSSFETPTPGVPIGTTTSLVRPPNVAGISAAANFTTFNNKDGTTTTTISEVPGGGLGLHVTTDATRNGIVQVFGPINSGPQRVVTVAAVYVVSGKMGIGTGNGGNTSLNVLSTTTGRWEYLAAINGAAPANEVIAYSFAPGGADFYLRGLASVVPSFDNLDALLAQVAAGDQGLLNSLRVKLQNAKAAAARGNLNAARNLLGAFQNEVSALTGKKIDPFQAAVLISLAQAL